MSVYLFVVRQPRATQVGEMLAVAADASVTLRVQDAHHGQFEAPESALVHVEAILPLIRQDLGVQVRVLLSPDASELALLARTRWALLQEDLVNPLSEVCLAALWINDRELFAALVHRFEGVDRDARQSAETYLHCLRNTVTAATRLYVHRNTLLYRMNRFAKQAGLDPNAYYDLDLYRVYLWSLRRFVHTHSSE